MKIVLELPQRASRTHEKPDNDGTGECRNCEDVNVWRFFVEVKMGRNDMRVIVSVSDKSKAGCSPFARVDPVCGGRRIRHDILDRENAVLAKFWLAQLVVNSFENEQRISREVRAQVYVKRGTVAVGIGHGARPRIVCVAAVKGRTSANLFAAANTYLAHFLFPSS
jgi:hypothetical protein